MAACFLRRARREGALNARSIVYIDGFNFYYGAVRGTPHKWLDLEACFRRLCPDDDLVCVHYFCVTEVQGDEALSHRGR